MATIREMLAPHIPTLVGLMARNLPVDTPKFQVEAMLDQEVFNFEFTFEKRPELFLCYEQSIVAAFRKTIMQGLSFDEDFALVYMIKRAAKIDSKDVFFLECKPTVNGSISLYRMAGTLDDLLSPSIETDPVTKQITKVTIGLVVPRYNSNGDVISRDNKLFEFKKEDFRLWQGYSHKMRAGNDAKANKDTLNFSNELYYNYKPVMDAAGAPTADRPGGINPGFAITKCTGHALKRANLPKNQYGRRILLDNDHKKYVEEIPLEEYNVDFIDIAPPVVQAEPQFDNPVAPVAPVDPVATVATVDPKNLTKEKIRAKMKSFTTKEDALACYKENSAEISKDPEFQKEMIAIGKSLSNQSIQKIIDENIAEHKEKEEKVYTADNI